MTDQIFLYHAKNGRYGTAARDALDVPESRRDYAQNQRVSVARGSFNAEIRNPARKEELLRTYLPVYNGEGFRRGARIAGIIAVAGMALLTGAIVADSGTAENTMTASGLIFEAGATIKLVKTYIMYML